MDKICMLLVLLMVGCQHLVVVSFICHFIDLTGEILLKMSNLLICMLVEVSTNSFNSTIDCASHSILLISMSSNIWRFLLQAVLNISWDWSWLDG